MYANVTLVFPGKTQAFFLNKGKINFIVSLFAHYMVIWSKQMTQEGEQGTNALSNVDILMILDISFLLWLLLPCHRHFENV